LSVGSRGDRKMPTGSDSWLDPDSKPPVDGAPFTMVARRGHRQALPRAGEEAFGIEDKPAAYGDAHLVGITDADGKTLDTIRVPSHG
jgi:hypothetical protein